MYVACAEWNASCLLPVRHRVQESSKTSVNLVSNSLVLLQYKHPQHVYSVCPDPTKVTCSPTPYAGVISSCLGMKAGLVTSSLHSH